MRVEFGSGDIADLSARLRQGIPVIVRVMTDDLPYWDFGTSHVIIVQDIDEASITLNDPAFAESSFTVSLGDFQLAWLAADNSFASIIRI